MTTSSTRRRSSGRVEKLKIDPHHPSKIEVRVFVLGGVPHDFKPTDVQNVGPNTQLSRNFKLLCRDIIGMTTRSLIKRALVVRADPHHVTLTIELTQHGLSSRADKELVEHLHEHLR